MKVVTIESTFESWRDSARSLLEEKIHHEDVVWQTSTSGSFFDLMSADHRAKPSHISVPKEFMKDAAFVAAFRDDTTWSLLYRLVYRIVFENKHLMSVSLDNDVLDFHRRMRLVSRDLHKVKAFVRFKEIKKNDESIYMAWHRPDHRVLKFSAPFFTDRFNGMNWVIFTEDESMSWINNKLTFGPGITQQEAQAFDHTEELWKTYYGSIFNPARIKIKAMKKELPVRHWATLPEASIIDDLLREAPKRLEEFYESQRTSAVELIKNDVSSLLELKAKLPNCAACSICHKSNTPVAGEGPAKAEIVFVSDQPGNAEDILIDALSRAEIARDEVYLTNAVKGFKSKAPSSFEISACRAWVKTELELIKPRLLVCLGASAAQSVFGKLMKVKDSHGKIFKTAYCDQTIILSHPSAILRAQTEEERMHLETRFLGDIMALKNIVASSSVTS